MIRKYQKAGILWLEATAAYELYSFSIITDEQWDKLTAALLSKYNELDVYLKHAIPRACLASSTGSGVNWNAGLPAICAEKVRERQPCP